MEIKEIQTVFEIYTNIVQNTYIYASKSNSPNLCKYGSGKSLQVTVL